MKYILTLIFTILVFITSYSQGKIAFVKLVKEKDGSYSYNGSPYTGESLLLWPTNNKQCNV